MREIKFRAWDKENKRMISSVGFTDSDCGRHFQQEQYMVGESTNGTDWILMQYTNLKDKNGKEIYEGDIIKYHVKSISEIKYGEIMCVLERFIVKVGGIHFPMSGLDEIYATIDGEIIGNIYENKELLT